MGRVILGIVVAVMAVAVGFSYFPSIKNVLGANSTDGYSYLLSAFYSSLKYVLAFFIGFAAWLAIKRSKQG